MGDIMFKKINDIFSFGFTEMLVFSFKDKQSKRTAYMKKEFMLGGSMHQYVTMTVAEFQDLFNCLVYFG